MRNARRGGLAGRSQTDHRHPLRRPALRRPTGNLSRTTVGCQAPRPADVVAVRVHAFLTAATPVRLIRSAWRSPGDPRPLPPADAIAVAPATFNTINNWAAGISDTLAVGILYGQGWARRRPLRGSRVRHARARVSPCRAGCGGRRRGRRGRGRRSGWSTSGGVRRGAGSGCRGWSRRR
ncbi:putative membrane protein [Streptomyces himastatinicus ATCC 53653]|uniref:Putative membrane protein n=1 Tax=Streptomyces himastatinicus ATCC 53653 TaxID=457427 RepID=D9WVZ2_9ACTN|nr:putative membrane protein [Streptomyces himastatinicus ATCC 53653]